MNKLPEEQWISHLREYCRSLNISTGDLYVKSSGGRFPRRALQNSNRSKSLANDSR